MLALLREVSPNIGRCEAILSRRRAINLPRAQKQHAAYAATLRELGARVEFFRSLPEHATGCMVEDAAVVLPEVTVLVRSGDALRLREIETVGSQLSSYRPLERIRRGTLVGGDVLCVDGVLYVGRSPWTDSDGISALGEIVMHYGYEIREVEMRNGVRLKAGCTFIPPDRLLVNPEWIERSVFNDFQVIPVEPDEPFAANSLTLLGTTLVGAAFPKTQRKLQRAGVATRALDISELQKVEAGLTSLSLMLAPRSRSRAAARDAVVAVRAPGAPAPKGHAVQAIVHGGLVYASGQLPLGPANGEVRGGSIEQQTEQILNNLAAILGAAGSSLTHVLKMTLYIANRRLLGRVDAILARVMSGHRPARVVRPTKSLPPGCLIEIEAIAAVVDDRQITECGGRRMPH